MADHPEAPSAAPGTGDALKTRATAGSLLTSLGSVVGLGTGTVATVFVVRALGLSELGRYSVISLILTLWLAGTDLGVGEALIRRANKDFGAGQSVRPAAAQMVGWALLRVPLHLLVAAVVLRGDWIAVALVIVGQVFAIATAGVALELVGAGEFVALAKLKLWQSFVVPLALVLAALVSKEAELAYAAPYLVQQVSGVLLFRGRRRPLVRPTLPRISRRELRFGASIYLNAQLSTLSTSRSEVFFFRTGQALARGEYAVTQTIASRATLAIDALFGTLASTLAIAHGSGTERYERACRLAFSYCSALLALIACPLVVGGDLVALPLLGLNATPAIEGATFALISVSVLVTALQPLFAMRYAEGSAGMLLSASAASLLLNLLASALFVAPFGLVGAAVANILGSMMMIVVLGGQVLKGRVMASPWLRLQVSVLSSCILGGLVIVAYRALPQQQGSREVAGRILAVAASFLLGGCVQRSLAQLDAAELTLITRTLRPQLLAKTAHRAIGARR